MDWPQHLRDFRKKHGLSQATLADALQISKRCVEDWEQGVTHPPAFLKLALERLSG